MLTQMLEMSTEMVSYILLLISTSFNKQAAKPNLNESQNTYMEDDELISYNKLMSYIKLVKKLHMLRGEFILTFTYLCP